MRTLTTSLTALAVTGSLVAMLGAASCAEDELKDRYPPSVGVGGFDPGDGGVSNGSGSGAGSGTGSSSSSGTGGSIDPGNPVCADPQKRCQHLFTYTGDGTETSVEVRGDFNTQGWTVGAPMTKQGSVWSANVEIPYNQQVQYKLVINGSTWITDPENPNEIDDGFGGKNSLLTPIACDPWTCAPADTFWSDAILYFVFVDRFLDGDPANNGAPTPGVQQPADYRGGDWAGVSQKIDEDYFTNLGVNVLWLSVPADNTELAGQGSSGDPHDYSAYHGYWPENLDQPEERFGTMADLQTVVEKAHQKNIKVIVDYAMNHVHSSAPVYQAHPDWFWPLSDSQVQNCLCGAPGCDWDGPNGKRCWFTSYLPDFNFQNPAARTYSVDNALWWIQQTGIDGFRLDAVKHIETQWLLDLRARVTAEIEPSKPQHFYMVGETFTGNRTLIAQYVNPETMLDGQFDFPLRASIVSSVLMRQGSMQDLSNEMGFSEAAFAGGTMSTFLGNHDVPRSIHFAEDQPLWDDAWAGGKESSWSNTPGLPSGTSAFQRLANAFTVLYTLRGVPLIYYGDEIGLPGAGDPDNRRPMQWSGYSQGQDLLLDHVRKLGAIRQSHPALRRGNRQTLWVTADTLAYSMTHESEVVYVAINRSDAAQQVAGLPSGQLTDLLTNGTVSGPAIDVPARSAMILVE